MSTSVKASGPTARERSRRRKVIYLVAIISLIVVLFWLSFPATATTQKLKLKGQPGGVLAQFRDKNGLSQSELGEIDPMSETVHLATLGMRGVGSSVLWWTATQQQMRKDWTQLRATLDQISKFQPHSIQVWKYQAWNLSYNVSVAFDDYHDKFYWVIEGLNHLLDGIKLNDKEPRLYWDMGWFISNKIGRADEATYYRRLFAGNRDVSASAGNFRSAAGGDDTDHDYSPDYVKDFRERYTPPTGFPQGADVRDNWQVGKAWFKSAESKIDPEHHHPVWGMAEAIFYSDAPTCQFYYADALEKDGRFDQVAVNAWKQASREWHDFGEWVLEPLDAKLQLNRLEGVLAAIDKNVAALDALVPGERAKLRKEKIDKLKVDNLDAWNAWNTPEGKRTPQQNELVVQLGDRLDVKDDEVSRRASAANLPQARKLVKQIDADRELARELKREREKVHFDFWRARAMTEPTDDCIAARKAIHDGDEAFAKGDQVRARPYYERGLRLWRKVLDPNNTEVYQLFIEDPTIRSDLMDVIRHYQKCLDQDDEDLPKPFILQDIIDKEGNRG